MHRVATVTSAMPRSFESRRSITRGRAGRPCGKPILRAAMSDNERRSKTSSPLLSLNLRTETLRGGEITAPARGEWMLEAASHDADGPSLRAPDTILVARR
jgi:hypothetical protein